MPTHIHTYSGASVVEYLNDLTGGNFPGFLKEDRLVFESKIGVLPHSSQQITSITVNEWKFEYDGCLYFFNYDDTTLQLILSRDDPIPQTSNETSQQSQFSCQPITVVIIGIFLLIFLVLGIKSCNIFTQKVDQKVEVKIEQIDGNKLKAFEKVLEQTKENFKKAEQASKEAEERRNQAEQALKLQQTEKTKEDFKEAEKKRKQAEKALEQTKENLKKAEQALKHQQTEKTAKKAKEDADKEAIRKAKEEAAKKAAEEEAAKKAAEEEASKKAQEEASKKAQEEVFLIGIPPKNNETENIVSLYFKAGSIVKKDSCTCKNNLNFFKSTGSNLAFIQTEIRATKKYEYHLFNRHVRQSNIEARYVYQSVQGSIDVQNGSEPKGDFHKYELILIAIPEGNDFSATSEIAKKIKERKGFSLKQELEEELALSKLPEGSIRYDYRYCVERN